MAAGGSGSIGIPGLPIVWAERRHPDHIDTFGVLASAAAELKCAADVIYATHSIPEAMLDATLARLAEAMATVRAIKEGTT